MLRCRLLFCRRTSAAGSHAVQTDDEDALLDGDALWEEDRQDDASPSHAAADSIPTTHSSLKLAKCLHAYGQLMR
jgi:hypothetical protein